MQLDPIKVNCGYFNLGWFSLGNLVAFSAFVALVYFGWTYIEAILVLLPLPDPKDLEEHLTNFWSFLKSKITRNGGGGEAKDYT